MVTDIHESISMQTASTLVIRRKIYSLYDKKVVYHWPFTVEDFDGY